MDFIQAAGTRLTTHLSGANCYYLPHKSRAMADRLLDSAAALGCNVVRTIAYSETQDEAFLQELDYTVAAAAARNIRLLLPLTNNWKDFGGMDAYSARFNLTGHDDFYQDSRTRQAYKDWCTQVLTRVNPYTGRAYKDEPTIAAWELANESRCGAGIPVLASWIEAMTTHLKTIDSNHLVGLGDEGFLNRTFTLKWYLNGEHGYDFEEFLRIPSVDFASFHLYPETFGVTYDYGNTWIEDHAEIGAKVGKPVFFEEYGITAPAPRDDVYGQWLETSRRCGMAADLFWMLADLADDGHPYPDYDKYTLYPDTVPASVRAHLQAVAINL
ncbi:MAG: cellulase family glycosylhydrolase [Acidobacteria bacterium]|nr:cellulase family glycosylhydrolase [Acidobacteriota bacterium]